ncbi:hypothetical protein FKP32DRAFT_1589020 [Trametes sanguinea]|nr:hypothetical protein FKP32DRAFT_1589020 [Trametes sanguinea]
MPRGGNESGYDPVPVCGFCIEYLQITACGKGQLKQLPMAKLKRYAKAYNINVSGIIEKDDFIDRLIAARGPNGCLPPANESYYRKNSVPSRSTNRPRGLFSRAMDAMGGAPSSSQNPPPQPQQQQYAQRPPYQPRQRTTSGPSRYVDPRAQQQARQQPPPQGYRPAYAPPPGYPPQYAPPPGYPPQHAPQPGYHPQYGPPPGHQPQYHYHTQSTRPGDHLNVPPSSRPRSASASSAPRERSPAPPPPVEVPSIDELLGMSDEQLKGLSISVLKEILFKNHVNARLVVEKGDLVARVKTLVEAERAERERHAREEEEERLYEEQLRRATEESRRESQSRANSAEEPGAGAEHDRMEVDAAPQTQQSSEAAAHDQQTGQDVPTAQSSGSASDTAGATPSTPPRVPVSPPPTSTLTPKAQAMASRLERTGLCVICQDEEANIAIVDCGHLAMCRECSDLIMKSTRECPLCRTRIVTESRLLRIFKA